MVWLKKILEFVSAPISSVFSKRTNVLFDGRALAAAVPQTSRKGEVGVREFREPRWPWVKHEDENFELIGHEKNAYHK